MGRQALDSDLLLRLTCLLITTGWFGGLFFLINGPWDLHSFTCLFLEAHYSLRPVLGTRDSVVCNRGWQTFPIKDQVVNISGFVGHIRSLSHFFFCFKQPFWSVKTICSLRAIQKQPGLGLQVVVCPRLVYKHHPFLQGVQHPTGETHSQTSAL